MASETDMRRHTLLNALEASIDSDEPRVSSLSSAREAKVSDDTTLPSGQGSIDVERSGLPLTSSTFDYDNENKSRRFSIMRYRNVSDPQLSLRAKQQTEMIPPVPRRTYEEEHNM